jgi:uncharacterized phage protein gp47/JayE
VATAQAAERHFKTFARGEVRDRILASFRVHLRQLINPDTGSAFTETEIATSTAEHSRFWIEADALDLTLLAAQNRGLFFADQVRIDRAATSFLESYHGALWGETRLPASGGSGSVNAPAVPGTIFVGSTIIPDPAANFATDPAGLRYQVLFTTTTPGSGTAALTLKGVDTGIATNIPLGTLLTWSNGPAGAPAPATVGTQFTGGSPQESDADYAKRILDRIRHKPAAGNSAHFRAWARESTTAVEDAFIYACALHAGTVIVCPTQKRSTVLGPNARIPSIGTLTEVTTYLTPPGSPVVPTPPLVLVVPPVALPSNVVLSLALPLGQASGWAALQPWPDAVGGLPTTITSVTDQTHFRMTLGAGAPALPVGITAPPLMVWNAATSRFVQLAVSSVTLFAGLTYDVVLSTAPAVTLTVGQYLSPDSARRDLIAQTIESYFDSLGPGEVLNLAIDTRGHRAFRFPLPNEEFPQRAGAGLLSQLQDGLGAALADSSLDSISVSLPTVPTDPVLGPRLITIGNIAIYPL